MILEFLEFCLTPCSWQARTLGFLRSSIQVRARHARCRAQWHPHLEHTRRVILDAARNAPQKRRALILGAGLVHDIPVAELSAMFEEVLLADMVHTLPCRWAAFRLPNVRLVSLDVTGIVASLPRLKRHPQEPLPVSLPVFLVDDPLLDFTVSVNMLSQLSWVPGYFLGDTRSEAAVQDMKHQLVEAHLDYLGRLPGLTTLITDTKWSAVPVPQNVPTLGAPTSAADCTEWDVIGGVQLPPAELSWDWAVAPAPERSRDTDFVARVQAYPDWKTAAAGRRTPLNQKSPQSNSTDGSGVSSKPSHTLHDRSHHD